MAEELQSLLERIQSESVEKAEKKAEEIVAKAKEKAAGIVKDAEAEAKQKLEKADADAQAYTQRSQKTLEQSARDLLITVGNGVENLFSKLVKESVNETLKGDVLSSMLGKICDASSIEQGVEISVNEADQKAVADYFNAKFAQAVKDGGVEIKTDNEIIKGFTVGLKGQDVYTDFTAEAIAEALMKFLRPQLAEIVSEAAKQD
jgi:V/A-type H+-transporting ATPase subunit E